MQFNHRLTAKQAAVKAKIMYGTTKGRRLVRGYARIYMLLKGTSIIFST